MPPSPRLHARTSPSSVSKHKNQDDHRSSGIDEDDEEEDTDSCGIRSSLEEWESVVCVVVTFIRQHGSTNLSFLDRGEVAFPGPQLGSSTADLISLCERSVVGSAHRASVARKHFVKFGIRGLARKCTEVIRYRRHHLITWASGPIYLTQLGGSYRRPEEYADSVNHETKSERASNRSPPRSSASIQRNPSPPKAVHNGSLDTKLSSVDIDPCVFVALAICWHVNAHGTDKFAGSLDREVGILGSLIGATIQDIISEFATELVEDCSVPKKEDTQFIHQAEDAARHYVRGHRLRSIVASCAHILRISGHFYVVHRFKLSPREFWNENVNHSLKPSDPIIESKKIAETPLESDSIGDSPILRSLAQSIRSVDPDLVSFSVHLRFPNNPIADTVLDALLHLPLRSKGEFDVLPEEKEEIALNLLRVVGSNECMPRELVRAVFAELVGHRYSEAQKEVKEKISMVYHRFQEGGNLALSEMAKVYDWPIELLQHELHILMSSFDKVDPVIAEKDVSMERVESKMEEFTQSFVLSLPPSPRLPPSMSFMSLDEEYDATLLLGSSLSELDNFKLEKDGLSSISNASEPFPRVFSFEKLISLSEDSGGSCDTIESPMISRVNTSISSVIPKDHAAMPLGIGNRTVVDDDAEDETTASTEDSSANLALPARLEKKSFEREEKKSRRGKNANWRQHLPPTPPDPTTRGGFWFEDHLETLVKALGIRYIQEAALVQVSQKHYATRGIGLPTPDFLLIDTLYINDTPVHWIDAKAYAGVHSHLTEKFRSQVERYTQWFGSGAVVFSFGYTHPEETFEKVLFVDGRVFTHAFIQRVQHVTRANGKTMSDEEVEMIMKYYRKFVPTE